MAGIGAGILGLLVYIGVTVYLFILVIRLVKAVERIAQNTGPHAEAPSGEGAQAVAR